MATNEPTDKQLKAAVRAFLREVKPSYANRAWNDLVRHGVDIDESDLEIVDAMRIALIAALSTGE